MPLCLWMCPPRPEAHFTRWDIPCVTGHQAMRSHLCLCWSLLWAIVQVPSLPPAPGTLSVSVPPRLMKLLTVFRTGCHHREQSYTEKQVVTWKLNKKKERVLQIKRIEKCFTRTKAGNFIQHLPFADMTTPAQAPSPLLRCISSVGGLSTCGKHPRTFRGQA